VITDEAQGSKLLLLNNLLEMMATQRWRIPDSHFIANQNKCDGLKQHELERRRGEGGINCIATRKLNWLKEKCSF